MAEILPVVGGVYLDGVQFNTDPEPYEPLNWTKRYSTHKTIGGRQVIQDFGTFQTDNTLKLGSGSARWISVDVMKELHRRFRTRGAQYVFKDWLGNEFIVFITTFVPVPFKVEMWQYTMELQTVLIAKLLGEPYQGE